MVRGKVESEKADKAFNIGDFRVRWSSRDREYGLACYEIGFDVERFICRGRRGLG